MTRSTHRERDYEKEQARLNEAHDREAYGHHDNPPPVTRYALKAVSQLRSDWYWEKLSGVFGGNLTHHWTKDQVAAARFDSATEAALFAAEHGITDVEVVAV